MTINEELNHSVDGIDLFADEYDLNKGQSLENWT